MSYVRLLKNHPGFFAFLFSACLSPWYYHPAMLVNSDGILYLQLAYMVNTQSIFSASDVYSWPFFSIIIASWHQLSHLSYINSAFMLENIFMSMTALLFVHIIKELGGKLTTQWFALFVFLSFETILNYRGDVFRDFGYWTFFLASFYFLLKFSMQPRFKYAMFWFFSAFTAFLFRVEGLIFLCLLPFSVFFFKPYSFKAKCYFYIMLYSPFLFAIIILTALNYHHITQSLLFLTEKIKTLFYDHLSFGPSDAPWKTFFTAVNNVRDHVLPLAAKDTSPFIIFFLGLSLYFLLKLMLLEGLMNVILCISAWRKNLIPFQKNQKIIFISFLILTVLMPYLFILKQLFISSRYMTTGGLMLLLMVPFALDYCYTHPDLPLKGIFSSLDAPRQNPQKARYQWIVIAYVIFGFGDFLFLGYHQFIQNMTSPKMAVTSWLYTHKNNFPAFCSSDAWLAFPVIEEKVNTTLISPHHRLFLRPLSECQSLVFYTKPSREPVFNEIISDPAWTIVKQFGDPKKDKRVIYVLRKKVQD